MIGIWKHILGVIELRVYCPIYVFFRKLKHSYMGQNISKTMRKWPKNSHFRQNKNFHISIKKCKISTYIGRKMIFEKIFEKISLFCKKTLFRSCMFSPFPYQIAASASNYAHDLVNKITDWVFISSTDRVISPSD